MINYVGKIKFIFYALSKRYLVLYGLGLIISMTVYSICGFLFVLSFGLSLASILCLVCLPMSLANPEFDLTAIELLIGIIMFGVFIFTPFLTMTILEVSEKLVKKCSEKISDVAKDKYQYRIALEGI